MPTQPPPGRALGPCSTRAPIEFGDSTAGIQHRFAGWPPRLRTVAVMAAPTHEPTAPPRHHAVDHVFNLRDLGGYATVDGRVTRWQRVFRSDGLHRTTPAGADVVAGLGIRRVIDLRTEEERRTEGVFTDDRLHAVHLPILQQLWPFDALDRPDFDPDEFLFAGYCEMTDLHAERLAEVFRFVAASGHEPLVFHCTAGKDRTGIVAALLLSLAGVDDDDIAEDFALSEPAATRMAEWYRTNRPRASTGGRGIDAAKAMKLLAARPETMHRLLAHLRAGHGSIAAYLAAIGLSEGEQTQLVDHLLATEG